MTATFRTALEHVIGAEGLLAIRFGSGEVRLRAVDGPAVRVHDRRDHDLADMFEIELAEGSLSLRMDHGRGWFSGRRHTPELDVEVPRRATLVIESASGDIAADGMAGDQRYRTASGAVALRGCAGRLAVDAVSGDIDVVAAAEIDLSARTVSGDLEVRAGNLPRLRASTTSGDLKIAGRFSGEGPFSLETVSGDAVVAPVGDLRIEMTTITGDLRSDLGGRPEAGRGLRSLVIGAGGPVMTFRSLSGDLRVVRSAVMERPQSPPAPTGQDVGADSSATSEAAAPETSRQATPDAAARATPPVAPDPAPTERAASVEWPASPDPVSTASEAGAPSGSPSVQREAPPAQSEALTADQATDATASPTAPSEDPRMDILRALERGEIDVAEAGARLEALDAASSTGAEGRADA